MYITPVIASQPHPAQQAILPWLDMLRQLYPPSGLILVGAGSGHSAWVKHLMATGYRNVTLVEADEANASRLQAAIKGQPDWLVKQNLVGDSNGPAPFYTASLQAESGLVEPESLRSLWPNIETSHQQIRQAITLADLQQDAEFAVNWLLLDCLPALPILQGAAQQLAAIDVIAVRVLLDTEPSEHTQAASTDKLQLALQTLGFRCLAIETSRHPALGHALFVRDTAAQHHQSTVHIKTLTAAHDEQAKLATERQTALAALQALNANAAQEQSKLMADNEELHKAKVQMGAQLTAETKTKAEVKAQRDAEAKAKADAIAQRDAEARAKADALAQLEQLRKDKAALQDANKLASERQQQMDQQQTKLAVASVATNEHTDLLRTLLSEVQVIKAQGQAATALSALEAPWLESLRETQDAISNGLSNFQESAKKIIKSVTPEKADIAQMLEAQKKTIENLSLKIDPLIAGNTFSDTLQAQLGKQLAATKDAIKEVETRMNADLGKGLGNAVKQIEAFLRIQSYLGSGDALGDFHGWPISPDIGVFLLERMREQHYDLIIEFGSGTSTALFAKATETIEQQAESGKQPNDGPSGQVSARTEIVTFEHDTSYHGKTMQMLKSRGLDQRVRLVHAPLMDWRDEEKVYLYYDCQRTLMDLADKYRHSQLRILLLVDGPPGNTCSNARYPAVPFVFSTLGKHQIDVVLDDAARLEEKQVVELWKAYWKKRSIHRIDTDVLSEKGIYMSRNCTNEK